jgi:hypothetical protein
MSAKSKYVFYVSMDVEPEKKDLFNDVYDNEHVPYLLEVPGVNAVTRLTREPVRLAIAGEVKEMVAEGEPFFLATYEIDSPDVLISDAWAEAVERGRWGPEVRPYTSNRRHVLRKVMD